MKKIKFLFTFDYELPLGKVEDYNVGLFFPTTRLIEAAYEIGIPIVFYADICSAIRFREWDYKRYYVPFRNQLQNALICGNDVQLHIHPHWMDSAFEDGRFIPSANFSLSKFKSHNIYSIEQIIDIAFEELTVIGRAVKEDYNCIAFRAGGYDVEPESARILSKLHALGIRFESSVIKGLYLNNANSHIDYRKFPNKSSWKISMEGPLTVEKGKDLLELPIASREVTSMDLMTRRINKMINKKEYHSRRYKNGGSGYHGQFFKNSLKNKLITLFNPIVLSLDREHLEVSDLEAIVDYNIKQFANESNDLILTLIGHPKSMGTYHIDLMKKFVERMKSKLQDRVEFVTYPDLYNQLPLDA